MSLGNFISGEIKRLGPSFLFQPTNPVGEEWPAEFDRSVVFYPGLLAEPYQDGGRSLVKPAEDPAKVIGVFKDSYNVESLYTQTIETVAATAVDSGAGTFRLVVSKAPIRATGASVTPWVAIYDIEGDEWILEAGSYNSSNYSFDIDTDSGVINVTVVSGGSGRLPNEGDPYKVIYFYRNPYFDVRLSTGVPFTQANIWAGKRAVTMVYLPANYQAGDALTIASVSAAGIGGVLKKASSGDTVVAVVEKPPFDPYGRMIVRFKF